MFNQQSVNVVGESLYNGSYNLILSQTAPLEELNLNFSRSSEIIDKEPQVGVTGRVKKLIKVHKSISVSPIRI